MSEAKSFEVGLLVVGVLLFVSGGICYYYKELQYSFWGGWYLAYPYRWFAMPMIIVGGILTIAGIIIDVLERPEKISP